MAKPIYFLFLVLSLFAAQSYSISFVNNVTMPSDVLSDLFLNEIRNNPKLFNISAKDTDDYDSMKCMIALQQIVAELPALRVLPFIDAWGSLPSGILSLHLVNVGNYDQCLDISVKLNAVTGIVKGQHCFASVPLINPQELEIPMVKHDFLNEPRDTLASLLQVSIGICVPDTCSPSVITNIFQWSVGNAFNGALSGLKVTQCHVAKKQDYEAVTIVIIVIFSVIGLLMVLSSAYDFFMEYFKKTPVPLLLAFSVFSNGKKLFAINTKKSPNSIDCLTGIRVFSMAWVLYCHNYSSIALVPLINTIDIYWWFQEAWSMHVLNATVSVDSFLFISGLLVAWLGLRELDRTKGKINILMMYIHRYLRLTPPVIGTILFFVGLNKYISSGPYRDAYITLNEACDTNWWTTLLYVQNYVRPQMMCVPQTWYLAVDFQLYILSPLVLIPMWKWGKKFSPVLVILALLSIGCVIGTYYVEGFTNLLGISNDNSIELTYFPTHTRYSPWLVGFGLGYLMHVYRQKPFRPSKIIQLVGWIVCFTSIVAIIFAPYFTMNADRSATVFEAAMNESLKRTAWSIALAWIVFACYFGFGGLVNSFLAHPFWQPIGRLTYSLYLVHIAVIGINFGSIRTDSYFSNYTLTLAYWSSFGISLMAAILLSLAFEAPFLVLEKAIFPSRNSPQRNPNSLATENINTAIDIPSDKKV